MIAKNPAKADRLKRSRTSGRLMSGAFSNLYPGIVFIAMAANRRLQLILSHYRLNLSMHGRNWQEGGFSVARTSLQPVPTPAVVRAAGRQNPVWFTSAYSDGTLDPFVEQSLSAQGRQREGR